MPPNTELTEEQRAQLIRESETALKKTDKLLTVEEEAAARLPDSAPMSRPSNVVDIKERLGKRDATVATEEAPVIDPEKQKEIATDLITGVSIKEMAKKLGSPYLMSAFLHQELPGAEEDETKKAA